MTDTRKFFHDRFVLFLLTINGFLALLSVVIILLRLGDPQDVYFHSYRSNLGLSALSTGGLSEIIAFVLFAIGIFVAHVFMAKEFHKIRKTSAWVTMLLTTLLLVLNLIVANALLDLR